MRTRAWLQLGWSGARTIAMRRTDPIVGSIIVTDRCNLACQHCAVGNIRRIDYPYARIVADMRTMFAHGVRILFLYGGEPFLWRDGPRTLRDLVVAAKAMGYVLVNVVTNGTRGLDLPGADLILVSLDGNREHNDLIRGPTYDRVLSAVVSAPSANLCLYMAINRVNLADIEHVCRLARALPHVRAVSFNIHTPYPGTEHLALDPVGRHMACAEIARQIRAGMPILNMAAALPHIAEGAFPAPCRQCVIMEDGTEWVCGRCIDVPGLCGQCGYFFAAELSLLFRGDPAVVVDALRTYRRFL